MAQAWCLIFGIIGAIPLGVGVLVRTAWVQSIAAKQTAAALQRELGVSASYSVDVRAWPLAVMLSDVVVHASDGGAPALQASRITVRPRLFALLGGRLDAGHIEIEAPRTRLVVRNGALSNLHYRLPTAAPNRPPLRHAPFTTIALTDGAIDLDLEGTRVQGGEIDLDVTAEDGPVFEMALRTGEHSIVRERAVLSLDPAPSPALAVDEDVLCQLDARLRFGEGALLVRRLALSALADADPAAGSLPSCRAPSADARRVEVGLSHVQATFPRAGKPDVEGGVHLRSPLALANRFAPLPQLGGSLTVDIEGHYGGRSVLPIVRGKLAGHALSLDTYHLVSALSADLAIDDDVLRTAEAVIDFADGVVIAKNVTFEPLKKGAPLRIASTEGTNVRFPAIMRDMDVTPHAHVNWVYKTTHVGPLEGTLSPLHLDADVTALTSDFEVFDRAVDDPRRKHMIGVKDARITAHAAIRSDAVSFRNSKIDFGDSHIEASVSLGFRNDIVLSIEPGSRVDLANISPLADLKLGGKSTLSAQMKGKFSSPVLTGDLAVTGFVLEDFPLGDITSSRVRFTPLTVDFSEVRGKKGKSTFDVPSARLDFNGPASLAVDAQVDASDLFLRDFLHMWHFDQDPRFQELEGHGPTRASVHYELGGARDSCGGGILLVRGTAHMRAVDLFGEAYDSVDGDFTYNWLDRDAADRGLDIDVRSLTMRKGRGSIFGSGTVRRGGVVRMQVVADDVPLSRLTTMGALGKWMEGTTSAVGTISGTLDELAADIDARVSPVRLGTSVLPPSKVRITLRPNPRAAHVIGRTACGQPITAPFDRADYDRDVSQGTFHVQGQLFGDQIVFDDYKITRQRRALSSGTVDIRRLDLSALRELRPKDPDDAVRPGALAGALSASLDVGSLDLKAPETMRAKLTLRELDLRSGVTRLALAAVAPAMTIGADHLKVPPLAFSLHGGGSSTGLDATVTIGGELSHLSAGPQVDLSAVIAPLDLGSLSAVVPRVSHASGTVEGRLHVTGKLAAPVYTGEVHLNNGEIALRGFPIPVADVGVDLAIGAGEVRIVRGHAQVGGGTVSLAGHAPIQGFSLGDATGVLTAKGINLPLLDGIDMTCDADLRAEWTAPGTDDEEPALPRITGDVTLTSFNYTRPIGVAADIGAIAQRGRRKLFDAYDPAEDFVAFDVRLRSREPLRLRNNLVEAQLMVDSDALAFSGTNQRYGLRGRLRILPAGRIRLRANEFEVKQGYVRFDDPTRIAPSVDVTAVTDYRRYSAGGAAGSSSTAASASAAGRTGGIWRITLHAFGDAENLRLDMTSEPALSQEDIVLLLTIGMTRAEIDQLQASSLGGTAALEALSSLTGADSAVKKAVPVIDDFRFGSAYSSRTGRTEPTVTVGKRLTDQVRANVTSGLSENREIRSNVEVKLTPRVSVQGSYDNVNDVSSSSLGNLGADVRWRLEFE